MSIRIPALAAVAALALGVVACTPAEQDKVQADANEAAARTGEAASDAGSAIKEEASQVGSAVAAGAGEAAQEVDETTDALARRADQQKAETRNDTTGNTTQH